MGLLSRANTLDENKSNPGLVFSDFIIKHSLKTAALLEKKDSNYCVTNSIGFDAESILSATSHHDERDVQGHGERLGEGSSDKQRAQ